MSSHGIVRSWPAGQGAVGAAPQAPDGMHSSTLAIRFDDETEGESGGGPKTGEMAGKDQPEPPLGRLGPWPPNPRPARPALIPSN
jgi:hypothetical protein